MPSSAFVSVRQASELIGICRELVRQEIRAGRLAGWKQGTKLMVSRESVDEWIALKTDEARQAQAKASGLNYLRHWDHPAAPTLPRGKGGRGLAAGRAAVALFKGTDTKTKARLR